MKKYFAILFIFFYTFALAQDVYPYYSNPNKQIEFEEKKIYVIEKNEKEEYYTYSGGTSYTQLANTWGYILLDEQPSYVVKQTPLKTHINYKHIYEFKIMQGTQELSELEFLLTADYTEKAKQVYNEYDKQVKAYNLKWGNYQNTLDYWSKNNTKIDSYKNVMWVNHSTTGEIVNGVILVSSAVGFVVAGLYLGSGLTVGYLDPGAGDWEQWLINGLKIGGIAFGGVLLAAGLEEIYIKQKILIDSLEKPTAPSSEAPIITQTLTNEQIKALAEAYNRRLYNEIKNN